MKFKVLCSSTKDTSEDVPYEHIVIAASPQNAAEMCFGEMVEMGLDYNLFKVTSYLRKGEKFSSLKEQKTYHIDENTLDIQVVSIDIVVVPRVRRKNDDWIQDALREAKEAEEYKKKLQDGFKKDTKEPKDPEGSNEDESGEDI